MDTGKSTVGISYNCAGGCKYFSLSNGGDKVIMDKVDKERDSATFFINPQPNFRKVLIEATSSDPQVSPDLRPHS